MIKFKKVLDKGLAEVADNRLLTIRELAISGTKREINSILKNLAFFRYKIKNYNVEGVTNKDYDFYMWKSEDENYITLTYNSYKSVVSCIQSMQNLVAYFKKIEESYLDLDIVIKYNTIDDLVDKVKDNINFENSLKEGKENE